MNLMKQMKSIICATLLASSVFALDSFQIGEMPWKSQARCEPSIGMKVDEIIVPAEEALSMD